MVGWSIEVRVWSASVVRQEVRESTSLERIGLGTESACLVRGKSNIQTGEST